MSLWTGKKNTMNGEGMTKYILAIFLFSVFINFNSYISDKSTTTQFEEFCKTYAKWVNKYPQSLNLGKCAKI